MIRILLAFAALLAVPLVHAHGDSHAPSAAAQPMVETEFGRTGDPEKVSRTVRVTMSDAMRFTPTELAIALSVLLLAVELARDDRSTLTMRFPWVIAFAFGLLHGFGFASALSEIGLPPDGIAMPLLLFNLGVEAGQILIVLGGASAMAVASSITGRRQSVVGRLPRFNTALIYGIGTITAYWCFERTLGWML